MPGAGGGRAEAGPAGRGGAVRSRLPALRPAPTAVRPLRRAAVVLAARPVRTGRVRRGRPGLRPAQPAGARPRRRLVAAGQRPGQRGRRGQGTGQAPPGGRSRPARPRFRPHRRTAPAGAAGARDAAGSRPRGGPRRSHASRGPRHARSRSWDHWPHRPSSWRPATFPPAAPGVRRAAEPTGRPRSVSAATSPACCWSSPDTRRCGRGRGTSPRRRRGCRRAGSGTSRPRPLPAAPPPGPAPRR